MQRFNYTHLTAKISYYDCQIYRSRITQCSDLMFPDDDELNDELVGVSYCNQMPVSRIGGSFRYWENKFRTECK